MVKFKFPGKPSKIVQRSLVSAYSVVVPSCDTSSISEDLCFGLSLFQSTFGDDDEGEPFIGFSNRDIADARLNKIKRERYLEAKMVSQGQHVPAIPRVVLKDISKANPETIVEKSVNESVVKPKERKKSTKFWLLNKRILNRYHPKLQIRHNFKALSKNSLMRFKHKSLSANYLSDRYCRKFILPSRSLHSSRVIKPNKRFIDHEKNAKFKMANQRSENTSDVSAKHENKRPKLETPSNKVIIREARLNITTETTITGPFSAKKFVSADKESRSGVITCGICGSVRFYKYVLQTRKFGIYSCEPCRRFILKMIKYSKQPDYEMLKCKADNGVGNCVILSVTSNRRKDSNEESFSKNFRCDACLLSLCLQKYIMPTSIRKSLIQLIPEEMKSNFLNGLSPDFKKSLPALDHSQAGFSKATPEETHDKLRKRLNVHNYLRNVRCNKRPLDKYDIGTTKSKSFLHKRNNLQRISARNKFIQENTRKDNYPEKDHYIPRGPRIKHVCRSASSVLRSSSNDKDLEDPCNVSESDHVKSSRKNSEPKITEKPSQMTKIRQCDDTIPTPESSSDTDGSKLAQHYGARTLQDFNKESSDESDENEDKLISTDFWEAYDPDEVYKTGFPLISSELLNIRALCFLCGSAGIEKLLYCVSCCEPYHWYCAEGPSAFREESELEKCRVNWVCRKCKVCSTCGERDSKLLISCQRCKNSYHNECLTNKALNKRLFKSDRPWVCPACLKCKSCNSNSIYTYVGNIPLCSQCFKLRQKGSFCPLCQRCYQDDDYNVKMMECGVCEKWIHAKCEGLSHEKYQILSFLPDTIEFVCRLCCSVPPAQWWLAVEDELKAGFLGILKCLCKNKKISDLFKESPRKNICRCSKKRAASISDDSDSCIDMDSEVKTVCSDSSAEKCDSGVDDMKDECEVDERCSFCCYNSEMRSKINNELLSIKAKVHNNQYASLSSFHQELEHVINEVEELDLIQTYRDSLKKFFPWFDPDCNQMDETPDVLVDVTANEITNANDPPANTVVEEEYANLRSLMAADEYNYENVKMLDLRKCNLCKGTGEAIPSEGGRLIYCDRNEWVHSNCALWSSEVFEEIDGSLQNVHSAISRGRQIRCVVCDKKGASVGCCYKNCSQTYHFICAKKASCSFLQNRTIYCHHHDTNEVTLPFLVSEKDFEILRPVYIEMDRKKKKLECHSNVKLRIGSLLVENLGKIDPHFSDNPKYILPIYYRCTRLFWSTTKPWKIIRYHIQIKLRYCYQPTDGDSEVNYTVDHSKLETDQIVQQVVADVVDKVSKEYYFAGNQNANDLLSPELQEAIYKDLPNDLLNDKTLQDIWNNYDGTEIDSDKKKSRMCKKFQTDCRSEARKLDDNRDKLNGKYLRDKNDKDSRKGLELGNFYNELCNKVKRKINFENTHTKKKLGYALDYYQEPDKAYKPPYVQSYENILQLDGMVDITDEEPVKCIRCHRTYRTTTSFERHLELCNSDLSDYMISSCESDTSSEEEKFTKSPQKMPNSVQETASYVDSNIYYPNQIPNTVFVQNVKQETCPNLINGKVKSVLCNEYPTQYTLNEQQFVQNVQTPTYVLQSFPKPEVIPTYVTVENTIPDIIQPSLQLQQIAVNQPQMNYQPVIPTIMVQPSVIETPTIIINTPQNDMFSQNNLVLNNQPMLFGMETVVSNTIMSSQYMTQSLTGDIGSSTMYQTTTTQVFQAAKQIPQPNYPFILVNSPVQQTVADQHQPTEKYMYVHVTPQNNVKPKKPIITKAVKNTKEKPTKVMRVKNNKPIAVQTVPPNVQNGPANGHLEKFIELEEPRTSLQPITTTATYTTSQPLSISKHAEIPKQRKVDKCVNTDRKEIFGESAKRTDAAVANERTIQISYTIDNADNMPVSKPVVKSWRLSIPEIVHTPSVRPPVIPTVATTSSVIDNFMLSSKEPQIRNDFAVLPKISEPAIKIDSSTVSKMEHTTVKIDSVEKMDFSVASRVEPSAKKIDTTIISRIEPATIQTDFVQNVSHSTVQRIDVVNVKANSPVVSKIASPMISNFATSVCPKIELPQPKDTVCKIELSATTFEPDRSPIQSPKRKKSCPSPIPQPSTYDMPDLDLFPPCKPATPKRIEIKSESEKVFDELLRQHKLSMETSKEEKPELPKISNKTKYKPLIAAKKSPEECKDKINGKKMIDVEKENFTLKLIGEPESKNWKTASISFEVNAEDGFTYKTNNLMDLWNKIIESVQKNRAKYKLPLLPKNATVNADSVYGLLGFENNASKYLLEQLPDAWKCIFYKPMFHKSMQSKTSPMKNETGCARTEPFKSSHKYDMFGWLASRHRKPPKFMMISDSDIVNGNRRITSLNLPMAMRFRHLKETAKETVGVFRSDIHGRGLFCLRDIDLGEMVIEYAGEVIRSTLTDKREKYYTSKGIGCYMFRIDDKYVVDATMCGNAARFINHSCEPNCYSRIVDILGKKHILIFALRKIPKGEELTYDYKFPLEDDKIYCHCLSRKCRKYLN